MRRLLALVMLSSMLFASTCAYADPTTSAPPAQLEVREQALGWWLGGSGMMSIIAGVFMLAVSNGPSMDRAREIEFSGGAALTGLGAAVLIAGIYTLVQAAPGPCETSGTALSKPLAITF